MLGKMVCPNQLTEEHSLQKYLCAMNVHFDGVTGVLKTMWFNSKEKETYVVHKNDMLIVEGGAGAGGAAIMNEEPPVSTFVQNSQQQISCENDCFDNQLLFLIKTFLLVEI